jgi:hypothetical protein
MAAADARVRVGDLTQRRLWGLRLGPQDYYLAQSSITHPGDCAALLDDLPSDVKGLCRVVQGLVIHHLGGARLCGYGVPQERLGELDTCSVVEMLRRICDLDDGPLTQERPPERRLVGCCRDFAALFCSMARHKGIPARVRSGYARYFQAGFNFDHMLVECWDASQKRWVLVDPEITPRHVDVYDLPFDPQDVPPGEFVGGGRAWILCRSGEADAEDFGLAPASDRKGWWFVRDRLVRDLAAQNRSELLLWDSWGLMEREPGEEEVALLDEVAWLTEAGDPAFEDMRGLYEGEAALRVPPEVNRHSPAVGALRVALDP